jgi:hypothetical protein
MVLDINETKTVLVKMDGVPSMAGSNKGFFELFSKAITHPVSIFYCILQQLALWAKQS